MGFLTTPRLVLILVIVLVSLVAIDRTGGVTCVTSPISLERLNAKIAMRSAPFAENVVQDQQLPVDDETRRRVEAVLDQVVACSNAGEPLRVWSLYSDAYLSRLFQIHGPFSDPEYEAYARPEPVKVGEGMRLETVERIWTRDDGIVVAQVVTRYPSVPMPKWLLFWFVVSEDRVEIEEVTGEISFSVP
jgi:hypothetical protein